MIKFTIGFQSRQKSRSKESTRNFIRWDLAAESCSANRRSHVHTHYLITVAFKWSCLHVLWLMSSDDCQFETSPRIVVIWVNLSNVNSCTRINIIKLLYCYQPLLHDIYQQNIGWLCEFREFSRLIWTLLTKTKTRLSRLLIDAQPKRDAALLQFSVYKFKKLCQSCVRWTWKATTFVIFPHSLGHYNWWSSDQASGERFWKRLRNGCNFGNAYVLHQVTVLMGHHCPACWQEQALFR